MERSSSGGEEPTADSPHAGRVSASPWGPEPVRSCSELVGGTGSGIKSKNGAIIDLTFTFLKNFPDDIVRLNLYRFQNRQRKHRSPREFSLSLDLKYTNLYIYGLSDFIYKIPRNLAYGLPSFSFIF